MVSGTGNFTNSSSASTSVSGLSNGNNTFQWTITNGSCPSSSSTVTIHVGNTPVSQTINGPVYVISNSTGVTYSLPDDAGSHYLWSLPSGVTITSHNTDSSQITVSFGTTGGTISVTESNSYGSATSSLNVSVGNVPPTQTISGQTTVASNSTGVTYSVPDDAGSHYTWSLPAGAVITSHNADSSQITVSFGSTGGNVSVTETNHYGSTTSSLSVSVGNAPVQQTIVGQVYVPANSTGITYSVPDDAGSSYVWSLPTGATITSSSTDNNQITVSFGTTGGNVGITETNSYGSATSSLNVSVGNAPVTQTITGPVDVTTNATGVTYSVPDDAGSHYTWSLPAGAIIASHNADSSLVTVNFGSTGGVVGVTENNPYGSASSSLNVSVGNAPVTQTISGPVYVATNSTSVSYSVPDDAGSHYTWTLPAGATIATHNADSSQITVNFGTTGGTVSVKENNSYGSATSSLNVSVEDAPVTQTISGQTNVNANETGVTYSIPDNAGSHYTWSLPAGAVITSHNADSSQITVSFGSTSGTVSVTETSPYGSATSTANVAVASVTGVIAGTTQDSYELYPNPYTETATLRINTITKETVNVILTDVNGIALYSTSGYTGEAIILGGSISSGIYFVRVSYGNQLIVLKLVKM